MAAASAPQASSLRPPSRSHGGQNSWNFSVPTHLDATSSEAAKSNRPPLSNTNGHGLARSTSRTELSQRKPDYIPSRSTETVHLAPARINAFSRNDGNISDNGSAPDSLLDLYGPNRSGINGMDHGEVEPAKEASEDDDPERSRWIHRDKLARIESQELQAAGLILPRSRAASRSSRREHSRDPQANGLRSEQAQKLQRGSFPTDEEEAPQSNAWDLRTPEEAAAEQVDYPQDVSGGVKAVSRIPVLKASPLPIPLQHLERDTPIRRTPGGGLTADDESISYPKSRGRSQSIKVQEEAAATPTPAKRLTSENSPTKKAPLRKGSVPTSRGAPTQRPKTRSSSNQTNTISRPQTRAGDSGPSTNTSKRPEGDPPWLATMFKPDPRLPPDQQLLPTVAKRLQQEQWEKEGKFGNTYDTDFRPLNNEPLSRSVEPQAPAEAEKKAEEPAPRTNWPLQNPRSPDLSPGSSDLNPGSPGLSPGSPGLSPRSPGLSPRSPGLSQRSPGLNPGSPSLSPNPYWWYWHTHGCRTSSQSQPANEDARAPR
ncbi:putative DNA-directed RNA polymerase II subunit RPB1 [Drepanopeziza brunnea f. sp. 'multigermtubi' MB_m1]|uniref:Putative DNA-directed RNA polymerase II subunit RPB1 n=1 Tax=Marssonina brunnea f. sp. multigermtubi (strain MB_m1) TaxID=1072389 RepID=K1X7R5_MARBU|nr:putative DNA-directed RNA polymerase II subunit RPB1 [Drepanopeziza brunnea f. sp. 'multigermtubi' MB_m1]EKD21101.1 putative DNA-directed RNA polymerase II subunit RPB1 [Drepanopeziza brunnea f. sp. 'multigermtubi' MB_m1]